MSPYPAMLSVAAILACGAAAALEPPEAKAEGAVTPQPAGGTAPDFDISEFRVLGNSVLAIRDVERAVYPFLGVRKSFEDVQAARASLEQAYHAAGFGTVFVDIPEQEVSEGIIRLHVTEGRTERVRVTGARYFSGRRLRAELPAVTEGEVPRLPELQRELATANAVSADRGVTPVLKAGRTPGTVDLELRVNDKLPVHGGLTLNNYYTPDTTKLRSTLDLSYGNLFQDFQSLAFEYQTAPERPADARVYSLTYVAPLWSGSDLLALYAIRTDSNVAAVGALSLLGTGEVYGLHFIHPFQPGGSWTQNLNFGADFKDFSQTVNVPGQAPDMTPIRYVNWSATYSLSEHSKPSDTALSLAANFGIRGLVNRQAEFDFKRFDAESGYSYLRGSLERRQSLFLGTSLDARLAFQLADGPLVSNEQFGAGGVDSVRGYLQSIALGDAGVTGTLELRGPTWSWSDPAYNHAVIYLFYDAGKVTTLDPLPEQEATIYLASFGAGFRVTALHGLDAVLDWADPLKTVAPVRRYHSQLQFQVKYGF